MGISHWNSKGMFSDAMTFFHRKLPAGEQSTRNRRTTLEQKEYAVASDLTTKKLLFPSLIPALQKASEQQGEANQEELLLFLQKCGLILRPPGPQGHPRAAR